MTDLIKDYQLVYEHLKVEEHVGEVTGITDIYHEGDVLVKTIPVPYGNCYSITYNKPLKSRVAFSFAVNFDALPPGIHFVPMYLHTKEDEVGQDYPQNEKFQGLAHGVFFRTGLNWNYWPAEVTHISISSRNGADIMLKREDTKMQSIKTSPCLNTPGYHRGNCIKAWGRKVYREANCTES